MLFPYLSVLQVVAEGRYQEQSQGFHSRIAHVRIHDFSYEAFFDFMMYVYTGTLQFSDKYMLDVWVLAKTYNLKVFGRFTLFFCSPF